MIQVKSKSLFLQAEIEYMKDIYSKCFVCEKKLDPSSASRNLSVNLPVCKSCKGSDEEKELLEGSDDSSITSTD